MKPIITVFFFLATCQMCFAQHYFFVEAEGGQAFYMKISDTLYSSSAEGFLIIPKVSDVKTVFTIGFPKGIYPEVQFELTGMNRDRGFLMQHTPPNKWILLDRQTQEKYEGKGNSNSVVSDSSSASSSKELSTDFANMLVDVTADKTLLNDTQKPLKPKTSIKDSISQSSLRSDTLASIPIVAVNPPVRFIPVSIEISKLRSNSKLEILYVDNFDIGKTDTIDIEIDFPDITPVSLKTNKTDTTQAAGNLQSTDIPCTQPEATTKDIRYIQKKLLGLDSFDEQLDQIEKIFKSRCFNVAQTMEIGWFLRDESMRLRLFQRVMMFISDKTNLSDLGVSFFKEENIRAFKAMTPK